MQNLPAKSDMNRTMSSREIAELTGKRHKHVMRDIRALIEQGAIGQSNFGLSTYTNSQNKRLLTSSVLRRLNMARGPPM